MDSTDRAIVNALQDGFPLVERPFAELAPRFGLTEDALIERLRRLLDDGLLSRFGPLFNVERRGGRYTLAAMAVPDAQWDAVVAAVNAHTEIAHNYARDHALNMWFVVAVERPEETDAVIDAIERETGLTVHAFPKVREHHVGLRLTV